MDQEIIPNYYAEHLAEINEQNPVVTTQDLCNSLGAMVIPAGTYVTQDVADRIARFKLSYPLELQVSLETSISPNQLFSDILFTRKNFFGASSHQAATKEIVRQCGLLNAYPLLAQKLTVFADRLPEKYGDTQSAAGFAVLIGLHLGLSDESMEVVFAAAQMHSTGLLNVNPEKINNFNSLTFDEQIALQQDQLSLGKAFLDGISGLTKKVGRAVYQHNERKDGSGWPEGIIGDKHSIESQVVGVGVLLHETYSKKLKPRGYGTRHLLPLLQIEGEGIDSNVFASTLEVLRQGALGNAQLIPNEFMPNLSTYLLKIQVVLRSWLESAKYYVNEMEGIHSSLATRRAISIIESLEELNRNSGLWEDNIVNWLESVVSNERKEDYADVETVALMFESIHSKFKCLQWSIHQAALTIDDNWVTKSGELADILNTLPGDYFDEFESYLYKSTA